MNFSHNSTSQGKNLNLQSDQSHRENVKSIHPMLHATFTNPQANKVAQPTTEDNSIHYSPKSLKNQAILNVVPQAQASS